MNKVYLQSNLFGRSLLCFVPPIFNSNLLLYCAIENREKRFYSLTALSLATTLLMANFDFRLKCNFAHRLHPLGLLLCEFRNGYRYHHRRKRR